MDKGPLNIGQSFQLMLECLVDIMGVSELSARIRDDIDLDVQLLSGMICSALREQDPEANAACSDRIQIPDEIVPYNRHNQTEDVHRQIIPVVDEEHLRRWASGTVARIPDSDFRDASDLADSMMSSTATVVIRAQNMMIAIVSIRHVPEDTGMASDATAFEA
ncbi:uncharacterized protein ATNIH1004_008334 [Aspergillus tanneri]|uniref:Uncharacterized protein n=1 Tax=Aspergillus tanneri TaxID=1220188 RepID=A0A5M9MEG3_9EURO|nr:uncharacterized protein ATNIH1004_008334 [Aspergillus tanneri]KAA8644136.1 hypothetical protein ATNIH1004_008334 [Aspergillus tanneri]